MMVQTPFEEIKVICEVLYVHGICKSLFLVGFIIDQGHVIFYDKVCVIKHWVIQEVIAKANQDLGNGFYKLILLNPNLIINVIEVCD